MSVNWKRWRAKVKLYFIRLFVLWLPFSLGCLVAIPVSLVAVLSNSTYAKNMLLGMDRLAASVLHWTGKNTISAECGAVLQPPLTFAELSMRCIFCMLLCRMIELFDAGHCKNNAIDEKLI